MKYLLTLAALVVVSSVADAGIVKRLRAHRAAVRDARTHAAPVLTVPRTTVPAPLVTVTPTVGPSGCANGQCPAPPRTPFFRR